MNDYIEMLDGFEWSRRSKLIPRDRHGIGGLANLTRFRILASEPPTPVHYHDGIMELIVVTSGRRECCLFPPEGRRSHVYTGNEAFAIFPNEPHTNGTESQGLCEGFGLQLDLSGAGSFLDLNETAGNDLRNALIHMPYRHVRLNDASLDLLRTAFDLIAPGDPERRAEGTSYLVCFLHGFLRLPSATQQPTSASDPKISAAVDYILKNLAEPISLSELADISGYSLSHFKVRFREETGYTPANYILARKIDRAKELLTQTDDSVTDIAYGLGWSTSNYFCTVFRRMTGMSPLAYRKHL